MNQSLLTVEDLRVHFPVVGKGLFPRRQILKAVDGVSFELAVGETLGIVGESGCGKSTLARAILGLIPVTGGRVVFDGDELTALDARAMRNKRQALQIIFQDPLASLDPRMPVGKIIAEPLVTFHPRLARAEIKNRVQEMMERVGLLADQVNRYPHEFSGGQCQRIGIARALILKPSLILCDEPVSALDVSIQAQIINLLMALQRDMGLALIFIAHDLSVVKLISHRVLVMYLGKVMEVAGRDALYRHPRHPYTQALIAAVPIPDPAKERAKRTVLLGGDLPSPLEPPSGCPFRTRCPRAEDRCARETPQLRDVGDGTKVACHFVT